MLAYANAEAMNLHLAEIRTGVSLCAHPVVALDGAGWHPPGDKLKVPDTISLLPLPPYSPQLNPAGPSTGSGVCNTSGRTTSPTASLIPMIPS
ncbi:MAG: hypothetical protein ACRECN_06865 [Methylocella sp.]